MTREDIIKMAREAGATVSSFHGRFVMYPDDIERFAALVAAQEQKLRFKCTVIDDQHPNGVPLEQWGNAAQRQWVGLTRSEAMEIINSLEGQDWRYAVDAIEAKLKEKNT